MDTHSPTASTPLHDYVQQEEAFYDLYLSYHPDINTLQKIHEIIPAAHVIIPSRYSCKDCVRNVPQMTRIAEHLPGWTWDIFSSEDNRERMQALQIERIPTIIVYDKTDNRELGRIIENPVSGSLEADLLGIVSNTR